MIQCQCKVQGKMCSTEVCGCHKQHMSCTKFCNCQGGQDCLNPFTAATGIIQPAEEATDADDSDINLPEDSDDDLEQDDKDEVDHDDPVMDSMHEWESSQPY